MYADQNAVLLYVSATPIVTGAAARAAWAGDELCSPSTAATTVAVATAQSRATCGLRNLIAPPRSLLPTWPSIWVETCTLLTRSLSRPFGEEAGNATV